MTYPLLQRVGRVLLCGAALLAPVSCSDFLKETPPSALTPDAFYLIPDHAESAVNAVYADMRYIGGGAGIFSANWQLLEAMTGTSTTETAQNSDLNNLYALVQDGNTAHVVNWWNGSYRVIAQANQVIAKVPTIPGITDALSKRVLGQAKFLRAWAYFQAVRLWGDIPLITKPQTAASEDFLPPRTPQEQIYQLILADLTDAEAAGLPWMDQSGRISTAAVKALLAKVHLTMAGFPLQKGAASYKLAADKAFEIITYANTNPSVIGLFPTYANLRNETLENRVEHLFSLQYNTLVAGNPYDNFFPNFQPVTFVGPGGTGSSVPTAQFYRSYEPGDLRTVDQVGYFYTTYFTNGTGALFNLGAPYVFKHFNQIALGAPGLTPTRQNNLNAPMIRYAEVLLMYAEAQNELGAPTQAAYDAFKRIRDRAQLTTPALSSYNQASFREAVWRERWWELCYEQLTWFDMVRTRKVLDFTTKGFNNFIGHVNPSAAGRPFQEKHLLLPLPRPEMLNNPNLRPQNPGHPGV